MEKILDARLSKGKGMMLGKLRTITSIEIDLQCIVKNYLIESAMLEKQSVFDNSLLLSKAGTCHLTDLKLCYDFQLVIIGRLIEE